MTKLDASGAALVYSTYLGGTGSDAGYGIAVDGSGSAYLTGRTGSADFPTTAGAFDTTDNGDGDAFVTKLDASGAALVYSSYLGGSGFGGDHGYGIALDAAGSAYLTGHTISSDFPTTAGAFDTTLQRLPRCLRDEGRRERRRSRLLQLPGRKRQRRRHRLRHRGRRRRQRLPDRVHGLGGLPDDRGRLRHDPRRRRRRLRDEADASGAALVYSSYLGGTNGDVGDGIAVDGAGSAYVTGYTNSSDFPTTAGAFDTTSNGTATSS